MVLLLNFGIFGDFGDSAQFIYNLIVARLTFVVGKGGVGKTTVSCALALHLAARHPRQSTLLMSTDPAHSLTDMMELKAKPGRQRVAGVKGRLTLWQIDSQKEFEKFLAENREGILNIIENGTFFSREEIAPLLDTTLPGMAEMAGLLAIRELLESGEHDHIVVDTAPFGHTLRLFEMPGHFQLFLDFLEVASSRDALLAQRFGGRLGTPMHAFLERWQATVRQVKEAFSAGSAEILLVTTPETFSLNEAVRSLQSLREFVPEMRVGAIVLNRVVTAPGSCQQCRRRARLSKKAEAFLKRQFPRTPRLIGPDPGNPLLGAALLRKFGDLVFGGRKAKLEAAPRKKPGKLELVKKSWPITDTRLGFTVGKGGVGKTTTTAALAFFARAMNRSLGVTVCSTDPAPSLDDIFQKEIGNHPVSVLGDSGFAAIEMDSVAEFRRWAGRIKEKLSSATSMQSGGLHVDLTFEKETFAALMDVVPPGVDEVFAIFRILDLLEGKPGRVLIDMAPTGHALELLRMPARILQWSRLLLKSLAAHRTLSLAQDVAVELAALGQRVRKLLEIMRDPKQSRAWVVMLPEPVPDQQTRRLLAAMEELGIAVDALFVNRVLQDSGSRCKRCARTRAWQLAVLQSLPQKYGKHRTYVLREFPTEIAGAEALKRFTGELWQIQTEK